MEVVRGIPPDFVMNLDEVGCHDFVDAQNKTVIAPASCKSQVVYYPVGRSGKRASAIVCISLSGIVCPPQIAVPRATIDTQIFQYIPPQSFQIATTKSGFVTTESFSKWLKEIFLPYLHFLRQKNSYQGRAVLILDGYLPHKLSFEQIDLQGENLYIHYLVPHSSDQTQPLDLAIFGIMKKLMNDIKPPNHLTYQSKQLYKMHQSIYRACSPINCRGAFRMAGLVTQVIINNGYFREIVYLDLLQMKKVVFYQISYISDLVEKGIALTPNQQFIYLQDPNQQRFPNNRVIIESITY